MSEIAEKAKALLEKIEGDCTLADAMLGNADPVTNLFRLAPQFAAEVVRLTSALAESDRVGDEIQREVDDQHDQLEEMTREVAALTAERDALRATVNTAASWFDAYAEMHRAKGAEEKACRNQDYADTLRRRVHLAATEAAVSSEDSRDEGCSGGSR